MTLAWRPSDGFSSGSNAAATARTNGWPRGVTRTVAPVCSNRPSAWNRSSAGRTTAVSPTGVVVGDLGGSEDVYLSWSRHGSRSQVATPDSYYGPHPTAVNSSGVVAGTLGSVKLNSLFYGRPGSLREVPISKYGNFDVAGISESGTAAGTLNAPYYQTALRYPEGVLFTAAGVQTVKANATSAVDAISPNGRHVVGRVVGTNSDLSPNTPA